MSTIFDFVSADVAKTYQDKKLVGDMKSNCKKCGLYKWPQSPRMPATGPEESNYHLIGEEPGEQEDKQGRQFYERAKSGRKLRTVMRNAKLNPVNWRMDNSIRCRKPGNAKPTDDEIKLCRPRILMDIKRTKPKVIMLFGGCALRSIIDKGGIEKYRGRLIPMYELGAWVAPLVHPSGVNRDPTNELIFKADMGQVAQLVKEKRSLPQLKRYKVIHLRNADDVVNYLERLNNEKFFGIDYETVNFRPYYSNSKMVSAAITTDGIVAYSFPIDKSEEFIPRQQRRIKFALKKCLINPNITKLMHNLNMEYEWSEVYLDARIVGPIEDTQRMAYAFDVRHGCHSLAFLTFCNFGTHWKDMVKPYIKNMDACPTKLCLEYGGKDIIWTFRNYEYYMAKFESVPKMRKMYEYFLIEGARACVNVQIRGALVDKEYIKVLDDELIKQIKGQTVKLRSFKVVKKYERDKHQRVNFGANPQIVDILYGKRYLALEPIKKTSKGGTSVDADVLEAHSNQGVKFCSAILDYRDCTHQKSNNIDGVRQVLYDDGLLHQVLSNAFTRTGRLCSSDPNMQNFPHRKNGHIRGMVVPPKGYVILASDYEQIEAVCLAIESGDKNFKEALANDYDIHYEKAAEIFGRKQANKKRSSVKNQFVFPTVYGAGAESSAKRLGISVAKTQKHINKLWREFPDIRKLRDKQLAFYEENLYVESRTGRRRYGPLEITKIINTPIQALASDFTVRSMIILTRRGYWVFTNEHDALYTYVPEETLERDIIRIERVMTTLPSEWVDDVQVKVSHKIGYDWANLESIII